MTLTQFLFFFALVFVGLTLLMGPVWRYLHHSLASRRDEIINILKDGAMNEYLNRFDKLLSSKAEDAPAHFDPRECFKQIFDQNYGRGVFALPLLLLLAASLLGMCLVIFTVFRHYNYISYNPLFDLEAPALAALAGSYMWVVSDFISRSRRRDFAPSDVYMAALRLAISIPLGYAVMSLVAQPMHVFVAFALGAFPLNTLTLALRKLLNKKLGLEGTTADETSDAIVKLQGVDAQIVERLRNEDITSVSQIAYCDPVRLSIRSNLHFLFITDCMNQALAWLYFQDTLDKLRPLGLRGAIEIANLVDALDDNDPQSPDRLRAEAALPGLASAVGQDDKTFIIALREIAGDPYAVFLHSIWE